MDAVRIRDQTEMLEHMECRAVSGRLAKTVNIMVNRIRFCNIAT